MRAKKGTSLLLAGILGLGGGAGQAGAASEPIAIGDRLEPFVDLYLVETLRGVEHRFQRPIELRNLAHPPSAGYYATVTAGIRLGKALR